MTIQPPAVAAGANTIKASVTVMLFVLAVARSVGGRVGWVCFGVASAGMVWSATSAPSQWIGVGGLRG